jgi:hypothetical protein
MGRPDPYRGDGRLKSRSCRKDSERRSGMEIANRYSLRVRAQHSLRAPRLRLRLGYLAKSAIPLGSVVGIGVE